MLTQQQIRFMPFRFNYLGNYVTFKQRYTRELAERIWNDWEIKAYKQDLMFMYNKAGTHGIIVGATTSHFVSVLMRVKNKHKGYMLIKQGTKMVEQANGQEELPF